MDFENVFKVKLVSSISNKRRVVFDVSPDLAETQNVNYRNVEPVHAPGHFVVFQNTSARAFNVSNVKLISRTIQEATLNLQRIQCLRGWTKPFFGEGTAGLTTRGVPPPDDVPRQGSDLPDQFPKTCFIAGTSADSDRAEFGHLLGSPPEILLLSAYSRGIKGARTKPTNINRVPVVINQLSIPYPSDVDYIPTEDGTPFPIIMSIDFQLSEAHSPQEFRKFDLFKYRRGILTDF